MPAAHVLLVPAGVLLIIASRGLARRSQRAWRLAAILMGASVLLHLLRGLLLALVYGVTAVSVYRAASDLPVSLPLSVLDTLRAMGGQLPHDAPYLPSEFTGWFPLSVFHEHMPAGAADILRGLGFADAVIGAALLAGRGSQRPDRPRPGRDAAAEPGSRLTLRSRKPTP
jgi:hypothetical protein